MTTTSPSSQTTLGDHPTGFAGFRRGWDGLAWTSRVVADPSSPELHERHAFARVFTHPSLYAFIVGVVAGFAAAIAGITLGAWPLMALGGALAAAGPIVALVLAIRRRLRIGTLHAGAAVVLGVLWGVIACAAAFFIELAVERGGNHTVGGFAFDGLVEEPLKLLLPVILLATGPALFKNPRVGVWMVVVASGVFGIAEAALFLAEPVSAASTSGQTTAQIDAELTAATGRLLVERMFVEIAHVIWTGGAAALIWLGAHRAGRAFSWLGLLGFVIAVAQHVINDAVLTPIDATLLGGSTFLNLVWVVLGYYFWFRPRVRQLVPPDAVALVPKRWRARVPRGVPITSR